MFQIYWGWQPALYLFLGGMSAGTFITAAILYLRNDKKHSSIIYASMWAAVICLVIGLLLLISELSVPLRGLMMWQSFSHFTSWMTLGAWGAFAAIVVFGISAVLATEPLSIRIDSHWKGYAGVRSALRKPLAVLGIALGFFVAFYTGMLLMSAPGIPLWNTWLLPCLFTVSGVDTGVALVEVISVVQAGRKKEDASEEAGPQRSLAKAVIVLVVAELAVLVALFAMLFTAGSSTGAGATAIQSATTLLAGDMGIAFWILVVVVGLLLPLIMAVVELTSKKNSMSYVMMGALGAIVGGCALRFLVLGAGAHTDIIMNTMMTALS